MKFSALLFFSILFPAYIIAQPAIRFDPAYYDFGQLKGDTGTVKYKFIFTNTGNAPLKITNVSSSCGCTSTEYTKDEVAPGEKGYVIAALNTLEKLGDFTSTVTVATNAPGMASSLMLRGHVLPYTKPVMATDPKQEIMRKFPVSYGSLRLDRNFIVFGNVFSDKKGKIAYTVYNDGNTPVTLYNVADLPTFVTAVIKNKNLLPGQITEIELILDAAASNWYGKMNYSGFLRTSEMTSYEYSLHFEANIVEDFSKLSKKERENAPVAYLEPASIDLGKVLAGSTVKFDYLLINIGKSQLIVRNVTAICGCTASAIDRNVLNPEDSTAIRVEFNTSGRIGLQEKSITVITNDPVNPRVELKFKAVVVENENALKYD